MTKTSYQLPATLTVEEKNNHHIKAIRACIHIFPVTFHNFYLRKYFWTNVDWAQRLTIRIHYCHLCNWRHGAFLSTKFVDGIGSCFSSFNFQYTFLGASMQFALCNSAFSHQLNKCLRFNVFFFVISSVSNVISGLTSFNAMHRSWLTFIGGCFCCKFMQLYNRVNSFYRTFIHSTSIKWIYSLWFVEFYGL